MTSEDKIFLENLAEDVIDTLRNNLVFADVRKQRTKKDFMEAVGKQVDEAHRETKTYDTGDPWFNLE